MPVELAGLTDVGRRREHNEDSLLLAPAHRLMVVADGMGGHEAGEVASNIAIVTIEAFFDAQAADPDATWPWRFDPAKDLETNRLAVALRLANREIRTHAAAGHRGRMGTTCVAVRVVGDRAWFAWVGDSRGYLFRDGRLRAITTDHSLVNDLLRTGRIRPEDVENFAHKNVITRALGMQPAVEVDVETVALQSGDVLLACSDGLTGMVDDERLASMLTESGLDLDRACQRIVDAANAAGGLDNITVALMRWAAE